jgi:sugar phosphate isomerase/epimerase
MTLSTLPLSYCTNVHPGMTRKEVLAGLVDYTCPVLRNDSSPLAAGLWFSEPVVREVLATNNGAEIFSQELERLGLTCHTLNAFPFGDFHSERVKENVYLPDWTDPKRLEYTSQCATILAALLPDDGTEGSISTVPLGFKQFEHPENFEALAITQLLKLSRQLHQLYETTGRKIRLAIEPEPFCLLETTEETLQFFQRLRSQAADAGLEKEAREYLGVCYDVCHQSVEFEDVAASIQKLAAAEIRINKVHITCAIQIDNPAENREAREALAQYVEPRYLHQTMAQLPDGQIVRAVDLTEQLALTPDENFQQAKTWRVHFHVPVNAEQMGPLKTTRPDLRIALATVAGLDYAPHLEVETYTWEVLPDGSRADLVEGLTRELSATRTLLEEIRAKTD